jgi:predicted PurR-regulated permease PerM
MSDWNIIFGFVFTGIISAIVGAIIALLVTYYAFKDHEEVWHKA